MKTGYKELRNDRKELVKYYETHERTLLKTISWRIISFVLTFIIVYMFTGKLTESTAISVFLNLLKVFGYYFHERAWNNIHIGKTKSRG